MSDDSTSLQTHLVKSPSLSSLLPCSLEEEWEHRNKERLINHVLKANRLVREANMLADELHKDALFKVTVTVSIASQSDWISWLLIPPCAPRQVPRSFLSYHHQVDTEEMHTSNEVAIRVLHHQRGTDSVWSLDALEEKVLTMREMYGRIEEGGPLLVSKTQDTYLVY